MAGHPRLGCPANGAARGGPRVGIPEGGQGDEQTLVGRRFGGARLAGAGCAGLCGQPRPDQRLSGEGDAAEPREAGDGRLRRHGGPPWQADRDLRHLDPDRQAQGRGDQGHAGARHAGAAPLAQRQRARMAQATGRRRLGLPGLDPLRPRPRRRQGAVPRAVRPAPAPVPADHQEVRRAAARHEGRQIIAIKVTRNARPDEGRQAAGRALQRAAARARVAGRRDLPPHARVLRHQLRRQRARHAPGRHARAVVHVHLEPGRPRVHVHARQPPVAQEHGRQRRRRRARRAERRRRPEPQLRHQLGPRRGGLVQRPDVRDLPRPGPGLRARDQGDEAAVGPRRLRVPEERPHGRRAAAVADGLPEVHAHPGQRDLRGAGRHRPQLGDPGRRGDVRPRSLLRALHHQRRHARRRLPHPRHPRLHPRGHRVARAGRDRLRVRGRRAGGPGGVPAPPEVLARPRRVGRRPGGPGVAPRQRDRGLLPRPRSTSPTATRSRSR